MVCQCPLAGVCVCVCVWHYSREDNRCDFEKGTKKRQKTVSVSHCVITKRGYNNGVDHSV